MRRRDRRSHVRGLSPVQWCFLIVACLVLAAGVALLIVFSLPDAEVTVVEGGMEVWATAPPDRAVSDAELFDCTRRWLEVGGVPAATVIPFVILPLTLEWEDFRRFMCRVHARTRYLYILQNGAVEEMTELLRRLRAAVPSERLIIEHRPTNIGYAAAVNAGYRVALQKPHDEVPFIGVFNCDVYFERHYFSRYVPEVHAMLAPDAARIRALTEEVTAEEAAALAEGRPTLRASVASVPGLSVSMLLPDRVRYGAFASQRGEFKAHVGMFYFDVQSMCAFMVSRLALLAGGFLDENCFPAYFEDFDWQFRLANLGFANFVGASTRFGGFYHGVGGNIRVINRGAAGKSASYDLEAMRVARMLHAKPGVDYGETKWQWHREALLAMSATPFPQLGFAVPVDVWVLDAARRQHIVDIGTGRQPSVEISGTYNVSLLANLWRFAPANGAAERGRLPATADPQWREGLGK